MPRMQQIIDTLEAERAELLDRVVWIEKKIEEFRTEHEERPPLVPVPAPVPAPKRAVRRGTAARASNRRHAVRDLKHDVASDIVEFLRSHPESTAGAVAKGLNADRTMVAAKLATMVKTGDIAKAKKGYAALAE